MSQLSEFTAASQSGQELSRQNLWPATIKIAGQCYAASRSGLNSEQDFKAGDFIAVRKMTFTVALSLFADAGQLPPRPELTLRWLEGNMDLLIESAEPDASATICTLRCKASPQ